MPLGLEYRQSGNSTDPPEWVRDRVRSANQWLQNVLTIKAFASHIRARRHGGTLKMNVSKSVYRYIRDRVPFECWISTNTYESESVECDSKSDFALWIGICTLNLQPRANQHKSGFIYIYTSANRTKDQGAVASWDRYACIAHWISNTTTRARCLLKVARE